MTSLKMKTGKVPGIKGDLFMMKFSQHGKGFLHLLNEFHLPRDEDWGMWFLFCTPSLL